MIEGEPVERFRERRFIKLAEGGIDTIADAPWHRGMAAIRYFTEILRKLNVHTVRAYGTAALRTADNGDQFVKAVKAITGISIQLIDGQEEARLIQLGVMAAIPSFPKSSVIMDIGGGSVEFIVNRHKEVVWSESFPIGSSVLYRDFQKGDPLTAAEEKKLRAHLRKLLTPLRAQFKAHCPTVLIGASGSFDIVVNVSKKEPISSAAHRLSIADFDTFYNQIRHLNYADRLAIQGIPENRVDMIVVAMVLIQEIMTYRMFEEIIVSDFALKEGVLEEFKPAWK